MDLRKFLPLSQGQTVTEWEDGFIRELMMSTRKSINITDQAALQQRNEYLSSALCTLIALKAVHIENYEQKRIKYYTETPPPQKGEAGITAWKDRERRTHVFLKNNIEFIEGLEQAVAQKISATQSTLRSRANEVNHGLS